MEGLIDVRPGLGAVVSEYPSSTATERGSCSSELERVVVEAKKLELGLEQVLDSLAQHWQKLDKTARSARRKA
jgi:hypothetical protein